MDDLLKDLGGDMTCQDLYKSVTGYDARHYSDDSDASSESGTSKYAYLEPPLYTYEELQQNTVGLAPSPPRELSMNGDNKERNSDCSSPNSYLSSGATINTAHVSEEDLSAESNTPSEKVAKDLSQLITVDYCFICRDPSQKHYRHEGHYKSVMKWLEIHTKEIWQSVDIELIFCQTCNLPLSGNDQAKYHYDQKDHKEKSKSFCKICLRTIEAIDMPNHCQSKKHLSKIESATVQQSPPKQNTTHPSEPSKQQIEMSCDIPHSNPLDNIKDIHNMPNPNVLFTGVRPKSAAKNVKMVPKKVKSYASALKGMESEARATKFIDAGLKALKSNSQLTVQENTNCTSNKELAIGQVSDKMKREFPALFNPLALMLVDQLRRTYCHLCDEPVLKGKGYHYKKRQHYQVLRKWIEQNGIIFGYNMSNIESVVCFACHLIFPTFDLAQTHYGTKEHEKSSKYYCESCMIHDNSDVHKNHRGRNLDEGADADDEKEKEFKHTPVRLHPEKFISESIKNMLTRTYCHICNTDNRNNHYLSRKHIEIFRIWLDTMILNSGTFMPRSLIFCECCDMNLLEMDESVNHYQLPQHMYNELSFCEVCIVRGSPEAMVPHRKSKNHLDNYKYAPRISTPTESVSPRPNIEGCETNTESKPGVFIVKKLNEMLSNSHYCGICDTDNYKNHNFTKKHVQNLRKWLDEMMRNTGVKLNMRLIFCEDCNTELKGTEEAASHYRTKMHLYNHLTYCPTCIFRGQPEEVVRHHHSDEHHETLKTLLFNKGVTMKMSNGVSNASNTVGDSTRDMRNVAGVKKYDVKLNIPETKGEKLNIPDMKGEFEKGALNAEVPKPNLHPTKENDDLKTPSSCSDKRIVGLVHLGIRLGDNAMKNVELKREEHEIYEEIFVEYWHLVFMLEMVPLDVCSTYLRKITKELCGIYKGYLNNQMDENQLKSLLRTAGTRNQREQYIQEIADIWNCEHETSKLRNIATTFLNQKYSLTAMKEVRRLVMLVRNLKKALEEIKAEEKFFKIDTVFQFNNTTYPYKVQEEILDTAQYEVYKSTLKNEISQLHTFIITQNGLNRDVVLQCLAQFNTKLSGEASEAQIVCEDDDYFNDYFFNSVSNEFLADVDLTKNTPATPKHVSSIKNDEFNVPEEIIIDNDEDDQKTENDSDVFFESAVECSCEGWCKQKNKN